MAEMNGTRRFRPMWDPPERPIMAGAFEEAWRAPASASTDVKPTDTTADVSGVVGHSGPLLPPPPANRAFSGTLGQALGAAVARAFEHERRSRHKLEVRFSFNHTCCDDGLTIIAGIADPDWAALDASRDKGVRRIAWSDLEPRAAELPSLVDEAVAELEANIDRLRRDETSKT